MLKSRPFSSELHLASSKSQWNARWTGLILCGRAGKPGLHADVLRLGGSIQFRANSRQLLGRQRAQESFEDNFRFAQARIEIIVQAVKPGPTIARLHGEPLRNVGGGFLEFALDPLTVLERIRTLWKKRKREPKST